MLVLCWYEVKLTLAGLRRHLRCCHLRGGPPTLYPPQLALEELSLNPQTSTLKLILPLNQALKYTGIAIAGLLLVGVAVLGASMLLMEGSGRDWLVAQLAGGLQEGVEGPTTPGPQAAAAAAAAATAAAATAAATAAAAVAASARVLTPRFKVGRLHMCLTVSFPCARSCVVCVLDRALPFLFVLEPEQPQLGGVGPIHMYH